jgi:hypothetical protein
MRARPALISAKRRNTRGSLTGLLGLIFLCLAVRSVRAEDASRDASLDGGLPNAAPADERDTNLHERDGAVTDADAPDSGTDDVGASEEPTSPADAGTGSSLQLPEIPALPSAEPEPEIAPIVLGQEALTAQPKAVQPTERPWLVVKTILGLLGLLGLAYLASHERVQAFERRIGISQVIMAGFPFVLLGVVARNPHVGILNDAVLADLSPVLRIGLGSIGFASGFRLRRAATGAGGAGALIAATTLVPFVLVMVAASGVLLIFSGVPLAAAIIDPVFIRDAFTLGTAGALAGMPSSGVLAGAAGRSDTLSRIVRLEEFAGMTSLAIVAAYFRIDVKASWDLPGTAWLLLTVGLGTTISAVIFVVLQRAKQGPELLLLALGCISFASGMAGYLRLSSLVVAFIAGAFVATYPGHFQERLGSALERLERPIYLVSLIAIGALWRIDDWYSWALVPVFVAARFAGKWIGIVLGTRYGGVTLDTGERRALAIAPMGALAIAIVVNAQLLYPGGSISRIVGAVIGGAILTEIVVQLAGRLQTNRTHTGEEPTA